MESTIQIIIVEDNPFFREGLKLLLDSNPNYKVIADIGGFAELLPLNIIHKADIILMDLVMPDVDGITATKKITWNYPKIPILAITMHYERAYLQDLMESGFKGCVFKSNIYSEIDVAIKRILEGKLYFPKEIIDNIIAK